MYTIYCSYHTRALEHLAELLEKRSPTGSPLHHSTRIGAGVTMSVPLNAKDRELAAELDSFLSATASMSCMRNLDLRAYLLLPVQRLCKYPLLLKEILKHTKSDDV
ncbi:MAG: Dbl homology domain-containing protein, partial [Olpidium bornovanus]